MTACRTESGGHSRNAELLHRSQFVVGDQHRRECARWKHDIRKRLCADVREMTTEEAAVLAELSHAADVDTVPLLSERINRPEQLQRIARNVLRVFIGLAPQGEDKLSLPVTSQSLRDVGPTRNVTRVRVHLMKEDVRLQTTWYQIDIDRKADDAGLGHRYLLTRSAGTIPGVFSWMV